MRLAKRTPAEMLAWATTLIAREQGTKLYGTITFSFENGAIVRVNTSRNELPTFVENSPIDNACKQV